MSIINGKNLNSIDWSQSIYLAYFYISYVIKQTTHRVIAFSHWPL